MKQLEFIHNYAENRVPQFNPVLFTRDDKKIIDAVENIILSCQRKTEYVTIIVKRFEVIDSYVEIMRILKEYQDRVLSRPSTKNKGIQDNRFDYIDLKDSDIILLRVTYLIASQGESDTISVLIAIPRVVDKFYFRLNGNIYSAMYQIVDSSTYNTSSTKQNGKHFITLKTIFQPIRIFRNFNHITDLEGNVHQCCTYENNTFKKSIPVATYIFAKFGFYDGIHFLGIDNSVILSKEPMNSDQYYSFKLKSTSEVVINTPKMLFDKCTLVQHVVYVILSEAKPSVSIDDLTSKDFWVLELGYVFSLTQSDPMGKGENVLNSLELIYDIETKNEIHLPEIYKHDSYSILRWMLWEYNNLRVKDNLNILCKKIKCSEYIANIYAAKISRAIYRLADNGRATTLKKIRQALLINPFYLITEMTKDQLINFRGMTTDMDSLLAIKFTYKGESGIQVISNQYKLIHPSNLGILDPDASSPSDPGSSGSIVPQVKLHGDGYLSEFKEPITFPKEYSKLLNTYRKATGMLEIIDMKKKLLKDKKDYEEEILKAQSIKDETYKKLKAGQEVSIDYEGFPLEGSGTIQYV